jgi:hypothetical protein
MGSSFQSVYHEVKKTRHQYLEFGPELGEIFKNLLKSTLAFKGGSNLEMHHFLCQTEFHPILTLSFIFFERLCKSQVGLRLKLCMFIT